MKISAWPLDSNDAGVSLLSEGPRAWFDEGMGVRRRLCRVLAAALVLGAFASPAAHAEPADATGWWWRAQTGRGPALPAPPNVPEGGLFVMSDPSGEQAIAAVAATKGDVVVTGLVFELNERRGTVELVACPAKEAWEPAAAGVWDSRPIADCELGSVEGVVADDGATVTFPLSGSGLGEEGAIDIVVSGVSGATFSVVLTAPDGGSVMTKPVGSAGPTTPAPTSNPSFTPEPPSSVDPGGFTDAAAFNDGADFPSGGFAAPIGGIAAADLEDPTDDIAASVPAAAQPGTAVGEPFNGERAPLALVAAALVVGAWILRARAAVAGVASHPLSGPMVFAGTGGLDGAHSLLEEAQQEPSGQGAK